jgi:hypothetical protein
MIRGFRSGLTTPLLAALLLPATAQAHSFGKLYNLPVPFWMYVYGAAAALLLSFLVVGFFVSAHTGSQHEKTRDLTTTLRWLQRLRLLQVFKALSVLALLLCMLTGFLGNGDPYRNFSMTFFWVIFVLGFSYLSSLFGDLYAAINPWQVISEALVRVFGNYTKGHWRYPVALAYWPALALYMGFIWIELFVFNRPTTLAKMLSAYTVLNLLGVWAVGSTAWFRYCEFLSVFLRLIAKMAPFDYTPAQNGEPSKLRLRAPFVGLVQTRAENLSLLLFVLFMLSSTAFDGLHATAMWFKLFWADPYNVITPLIGKKPIMLYAILRPYYVALQSFCLLLSPFLYLAAYLLFVAMAKWITRSAYSVRELALRFAFSLLPIALVYNITHYYTLILTQGVKIISLLSDPFGFGWNIFGTADLYRAPILPAMGTVWHTQVGLIVFGHIVSVYLAHLEALRIFPTRAQAALSQLPMLLLMVLFTTIGLWVLAQPITGGG